MSHKSNGITVYDPERTHPGEIVFMVKIDAFSTQLTQSNAIVLAVAEGVRDYVKETAARQMLELIKDTVAKQIEQEVAKFAAQHAVEIASKLDLQGMANIAAIRAAKQLGAKFEEAP